MPRLLYLSPGLNPAPQDARFDKFFYASEVVEGDVLIPVWWSSDAEGKRRLGDHWPVTPSGRFLHHMYPLYGVHPRLRTLAKLAFFVRKGLELHRRRPFDYIMTYGTNIPGVAGVILKLLTGAKLIPELPNVPHHQYRYTEPVFNLTARFKKFLSDVLLHIVLEAANAVKLLYPAQLDHYPLLQRRPRIVFHDMTPVSVAAEIARGVPTQTNSILLIGFPWYTKGADILIRAFRSIESDFPNYKVVIIGHIEDRAYLEQLIGDSSQIELQKPVPSLQVYQMMASCAVYVSASRSEGIARVLMEAMAVGKAIVASAVGGTPFLIQDGDSGVLFETENVRELAQKLRILLTSPELRSRLGRRAFERVMAEFDERAYVRGFEELVRHFDGPVPSIERAGTRGQIA